jgi:hypothetical protein
MELQKIIDELYQEDINFKESWDASKKQNLSNLNEYIDFALYHKKNGVVPITERIPRNAKSILDVNQGEWGWFYILNIPFSHVGRVPKYARFKAECGRRFELNEFIFAWTESGSYEIRSGIQIEFSTNSWKDALDSIKRVFHNINGSFKDYRKAQLLDSIRTYVRIYGASPLWSEE